MGREVAAYPCIAVDPFGGGRRTVSVDQRLREVSLTLFLACCASEAAARGLEDLSSRVVSRPVACTKSHRHVFQFAGPRPPIERSLEINVYLNT